MIDAMRIMRFYAFTINDMKIRRQNTGKNLRQKLFIFFTITKKKITNKKKRNL